MPGCEFDPDILSAVFFGKGARSRQETPPTLERYRNRPMKYWFHYLRSSFHAMRGNEAHFNTHNASIQDWRDFKAGVLPEPEPKIYDLERTLVSRMAQKGDRLVVLGATWAIDGLDACFQGLADNQGVEISQLIHDLIPIITPEHIAGDFSQEFYRWLKTSTGYCASYFANSKNTARDLAAFMTEIGVERPIQTVPLAQEFTLVEPKTTFKTNAPDGAYKARVARTLGILGSVDANRGDPQNGWDTDQFPNNAPEAALAFYEVLKAGGFTTGGTNFDAKLRRQSLDPEDLIAAHVGAMDICARGFKAAAALIDDGGLQSALKDRYAGWETPEAQNMLQSDFDSIFDNVVKGNVDPKPRSGRQERLENLVNRFV